MGAPAVPPSPVRLQKPTTANRYPCRMDIVFIRHGQPQWAVDGLSQTDPALTELGHEQAKLAAVRIANDRKPAEELIVSPAIRAQQTAAPIAEATGLDADDHR